MSSTPRLVRVVVVEDSRTQRDHLVRALEVDGDLSVVGEAANATDAIATIEALRPDVVTLELVIPGGGGQHVIEQVMATAPTPILVLSATAASRDASPAAEALAAGAVDVFAKPSRWSEADESEMRRLVRALSGVAVVRRRRPSSGARRRPSRAYAAPAGRGVVAIAGSTGGPPALATVLAELGPVRSPVLVVQHLHGDFVPGLVAWMAKASPLPVRLAEHDEPLEPGTVYIAPGGSHLRMSADRRIALCREPATLHRPSADELFQSVAEHATSAGIGVVLTGMGDDGATGLLALRRAGGTTFAQDEASSAVFGMPRAAQRIGAVTELLPVGAIAAAILRAEHGAR